METYRSFGALAEHLDQVLPAEAPSAVPVAVLAGCRHGCSGDAAAGAGHAGHAGGADAGGAPVAAASQTGSLVQQVIQQQMLLMSQQLAVAGPALCLRR